jgi:hypothetical protein
VDLFFAEETAWLPKGNREVNRFLLCAPTALWSAIERCLVLLAVVTVLIAMAPSALAAEGAVVTVHGRVRALVLSESSSSKAVSATGSRPALTGDSFAARIGRADVVLGSTESLWELSTAEAPPAAHECVARQPHLISSAASASPDALEGVASITHIAPSTWGSARARVGSLSRMKPAVQTPKPE